MLNKAVEEEPEAAALAAKYDDGGRDDEGDEEEEQVDGWGVGGWKWRHRGGLGMQRVMGAVAGGQAALHHRCTTCSCSIALLPTSLHAPPRGPPPL